VNSDHTGGIIKTFHFQRPETRERVPSLKLVTKSDKHNTFLVRMDSQTKHKSMKRSQKPSMNTAGRDKGISRVGTS